MFKHIESLMFLSNDQLQVIGDDGQLLEVVCTFNTPATSDEIDEFFISQNWYIPAEYREFLLVFNGARLYKLKEAGGGFIFLSLQELLDYRHDFFPEHLIPIVYYEGDLLVIDSNKVRLGSNYLYWYTHDYPLDDALKELKIDFSTWLKRLITSQGNCFWEWYDG